MSDRDHDWTAIDDLVDNRKGIPADLDPPVPLTQRRPTHRRLGDQPKAAFHLADEIRSECRASRVIPPDGVVKVAGSRRVAGDFIPAHEGVSRRPPSLPAKTRA
jgi:hypothetical protein